MISARNCKGLCQLPGYWEVLDGVSDTCPDSGERQTPVIGAAGRERVGKGIVHPRICGRTNVGRARATLNPSLSSILLI